MIDFNPYIRGITSRLSNLDPISVGEYWIMLAAYGGILVVSKRFLLSPSLYLKALKLCNHENVEKQVLLIHGNSVANGFSSNLQLNNRLIDLYSKQGDVKYARKLFDRIPKRDVVSWTVMISGFSQCGYHRNALLLFKEMHREDVRANRFTYGSVLKSCRELGCLKEGMQIQGCVERGTFAGNLKVRSALLCLYATCGKVEEVRLLFDTMTQRDLVSWNVMIDAYTGNVCANTSFSLFQLMLAEGKKPDCFTFGSLLRASIQVKCLSIVGEIHGLAIKLDYGRSSALIRSLIDAYVKCGSLTNARKLFEGVTKRDLISCTALITGFAQQAKYTSDAFDVFKEMILMKTQMDEIIVSIMLKICTRIASVSIGRQIHCFALKSSKVRFDVALVNSLMDMYAKSGEIEDAILAFEEMEEKDVGSWTSLIAGYGRHGNIEKVIDIYSRMEHAGIKPNDVTFLSLLSACSHTGQTELGWTIFNSMINKHRIEAREEHLSCIVDMLARSGSLEEAYELIRNKEGTISLSSSTWGAFLDACRRHGNTHLSEVAATQLLSMEPLKPVNYINLASVYAANGAWDNALKTRKLMEKRGSCNKAPGYSLLY